MSHILSNTFSDLTLKTKSILPVTEFSQRLRQACDDLKLGKPIVLLDDFDRENEADLVFSAQHLSEFWMAKMIRDCSGIVCLCLTEEKADALGLALMVSHNQSRHGTAFTVSIEAAEGVTTGVSAADRLHTIRTAIAPSASASDLSRPGHVFPLRAKNGGTLVRRGHTEGSIDLVRLAQAGDAAVLCELMNEDGSMMKGEQVFNYAQQHQLVVLSIDELARYLMANCTNSTN